MIGRGGERVSIKYSGREAGIVAKRERSNKMGDRLLGVVGVARNGL